MNLIATISLALGATMNLFSPPQEWIKDLAIRVPKGQSRSFVFTNKQAAFYYAETGSRNTSGFQGLNVMTHEYLEDYVVEVNGQELLRSEAEAEVYPHKLIRRYLESQLEEEVALLDSINVLAVKFRSKVPIKLSILPAVSGWTRADQFVVQWDEPRRLLFVAQRGHLQRTPDANYPVWIGISALPLGEFTPGSELSRQDFSGYFLTPAWVPGKLSVTLEDSALVCFIVGDTKEEVVRIHQRTVPNVENLLQKRRERMEGLLEDSYFKSSDARLDKALRWAKLSLDALIMNQGTKGIFAGLPWFNNYWGRDTFISLPGATLVLGRYAEAREILASFAKYQLTNTRDSRYGRIPNRITPTEVIYNTADGTPWFVKSAWEYIQASGDTAFAREIFPVVKRSIEGALRYHADDRGFLTHEDAETWMDAVGPQGPWSPRGNRAVEIQALWYAELEAAAEMAWLLREKALGQKWKDIARRVKKSFQEYFWDEQCGCLYDHLRPDGSPNRQLRPNQIFALTVPPEGFLSPLRGAQILKTVVTQLTYPYGVASLSQDDSNFHPFHHYPPYYVPDAAYHNGVVWTWLAGPVISALVKYRLQDLAFQLTQSEVEQILDWGAVGTLSELLEAVPRAGERRPRTSGTESQAWSLAEFVRNVYQDYLGISVNGLDQGFRLAPSLPASLDEVLFTFRLGKHRIQARYRQDEESFICELFSDEIEAPVYYEISWREGRRVCDNLLKPSEISHIEIHRKTRKVYVNGRPIPWQPIGYDTLLFEQILSTLRDEKGILAGLTFATPRIRKGLKALEGPKHRLLIGPEVKAPLKKPQLIAQFDDPPHDDVGPTGGYVYPKSPFFVPGILDLLGLKVTADEERVHFELRFRQLVQPGWHPEYGFQLTYVAIAIDQDGIPSSGARDVGMNANYRLPLDFGYERIIYVGGGLRVDDDKGNLLAEYIPMEVGYPLGDTRTKTISFAVPIEILGRPSERWRFAVLVGAQDDHGGAGLGEFRNVSRVATEWNGGGAARESGNCNVYDFLLPEGELKSER